MGYPQLISDEVQPDGLHAYWQDVGFTGLESRACLNLSLPSGTIKRFNARIKCNADEQPCITSRLHIYI